MTSSIRPAASRSRAESTAVAESVASPNSRKTSNWAIRFIVKIRPLKTQSQKCKLNNKVTSLKLNLRSIADRFSINRINGDQVVGRYSMGDFNLREVGNRGLHVPPFELVIYDLEHIRRGIVSA